MGIPVLITGKSGSGKSTSLRNFKEAGVVNVLGKPLPFKQSDGLKQVNSSDYNYIKKVISMATTKAVIIDDAGYLITNQFMTGHSSGGKGNSIFELYNDIGDSFWSLVRFISNEVDADKIIYLIMHEDKNDFGEVKPKTIGKLLDEKVCLEGMFTIVLRSINEGGKYIFRTHSDGLDVAKTPIGMFEEDEIDNDLAAVDEKIREYYGITTKKGKTNGKD